MQFPFVATVCVLACLIGGPPTHIAAQDVSPPRVGDRVRVRTAECMTHDGRVRLLSPSLLEIQPEEGGQSVSLTLTSVERLQIHRGQRRWKAAGAMLGMVGGAVVGAVEWSRRDSGCGSNDIFCGEGWYALTGAIVGLPVGLIVGAL